MAPRALPRFVANTNPTATLSSSTDFPGSPVIRPTLLPPISRRDEEGFSSCATRPVSPCCHFHPAGVTDRLSQITVRHAVFASRLQARPPGTSPFRGHIRDSLALRPDDLLPSRRWPCRWASEIRFPSSLPSELQGSGFYLGGSDSRRTRPPSLDAQPSRRIYRTRLSSGIMRLAHGTPWQPRAPVDLRKWHDFRPAARGAFSGPPSLLTPRRPRAFRARFLHLGM